MAGRSGRRTRVYDCNYNMGESYYRPALDRLDRKYSGRPETPERAAEHSIFERSAPPDEPALFDVRGARAPRGRPLSSALDDDTDFSDQVTSSLRRLRANKKSSAFAEDVDLESTVANLQNRSRLGLSDKLLDTVGLGKEDVISARRALDDERNGLVSERRSRRVMTTTSTSDSTSGGNEVGMTRWSALKSADEEVGAAAQRARQSRARLTDLEDEMTEMNARQAKRDQRLASLRALVADSDSSSSKISIRSEKKQVTF